MSIVSVHGPYTFGSKAVTSGETAYATVDPANGLIWTLQPDDKSQVAANYDWAYTPAGGAPASPILNTMSPVITFTTPGAKTITLTLNGVAQTPFVVNAVTGAGAPGTSLRGVAPEEHGETGPPPPESEEYDPNDYTVAEVKEWAEAAERTDQELVTAYNAEAEGKNRTTVLSHLESLLPYDPAEYNVNEVVEYAEDNPDQLEDIIAAEQAGKNRSTLISHLEALRS